ncbi:MAG: BTAD domain-containing putative transcriptional regulator, partial [Anaerolineae bacterium]
MAQLALFLFGPPRLERDGVPLQFDTRKILALVAYVAISDLETEGGHTSRESLTALLWPDLEPGRGRAILRRNLSLLRRALHDEWLRVDRQTVSTDPGAEFWLDVAEFRHLVGAWQSHGHPQEEVCPSCLEDLADAVALYQSDFLEGFGLRDSLAYDDWQFFQAEELRQQLAQALERLIRGHAAREEYGAALPHARRRLALDPLHEAAHRQLMQLYAWTGQRSAALRQYEECARILDEEMGLAPSPETTALYEQIRTSLPAEGEPRPRPGPAAVTATRTARHNLPAPTTPFVGRQDELAQLRARLQAPDCRLLSLLGPGGIGKTRLALELAHDLAGTRPAPFEHGVFFVPLAPISTVEGLVPAVAEAMGYTFYTETEGRAGARTRATPRQQLLDYLQRKTLLLVLDNYEHLLLQPPSGNGNGRGDE